MTHRSDLPPFDRPTKRHDSAGGGRTLSADVAWGVRQGLWYAAAFGALGLVAWLLDRQSLARHGFTLLGMLGYYALLGISIGAVMGVLRPLGRKRWGAALMGWVAFAMLIAQAGLLGGMPLGVPLAVMSLGLGAPAGALCGLHAWRRLGEGARARPPAI